MSMAQENIGHYRRPLSKKYGIFKFDPVVDLLLAEDADEGADRFRFDREIALVLLLIWGMWSDNIDAIIHSSSVLAEVTQSISREWANFARERMEQNFNRFDALLRCRTPHEFAAVQSELLRDNLESLLQCSRRIAEKSMQMAEEATKRAAEAVEQARAA